METCFKRVFLYSCIGLFVGIFGKTWAQSRVSTEKSLKNVLIEEFTGIGCGNCPDGQVYIKKLILAHPERIFALSIHQGYYAEPSSGKQPDYRTDFGDSLYLQGSDFGYPSANINRHLFPGHSIMNMGRRDWTKTSKSESRDTAIVNIWASATLDHQSRELIVNVEAYYTGNSAKNFNLLNVALMQNRVSGPQNGGGENYLHNHMLRHFLTGQWGDTIKDPKKGKLFTKEYRYTVPADYRKVEAVLKDMELLVYITETKIEVENVIAVKPFMLNFEESSNVEVLIKDLPTRYGYTVFPLLVRNTGNDTIKQIEFNVKLNGKEEICVWNKEAIPPYYTRYIDLETENDELLSNNTLLVLASKINGRTIENKELKAEFSAPVLSTENIVFFAKTDTCPDENEWILKDENGTVLKAWGPFPAGKQTEFTDSMCLEKDKTYCVEIIDHWGDGLLEPTAAYFKMYSTTPDGQRSLLAQSFEIREFGSHYFFTTSKKLSKEKTTKNLAKLSLSPNPCSEYTKLKIVGQTTGRIEVKIFDVAAHLKHRFSVSPKSDGLSEFRIDTENFSKGLYFISVQYADGKTEVLKLIKN